jgi:excisionase family DNA binding protein
MRKPPAAVSSPVVPKLLTLRQCSELTGLPRWRLYDLVSRGQIPSMRVGKTIRFSEAALVAWIRKEHAQHQTGGAG